VSAKAWLRPKDIAEDLGVTTQHATRLIKRIPGAELLYRHGGGERWRVSREAYDAWRNQCDGVA
jgi:DNA-binding MarR family transcriptional regulator